MIDLQLLPNYVKLLCFAVVIIAAGIWAGFHFSNNVSNGLIIACKISLIAGLYTAIFCKERNEEERNNTLRLRAAFSSLSLLGAFLITDTISPNTNQEDGLGFLP